MSNAPIPKKPQDEYRDLVHLEHFLNQEVHKLKAIVAILQQDDLRKSQENIDRYYPN